MEQFHSNSQPHLSKLFLILSKTPTSRKFHAFLTKHNVCSTVCSFRPKGIKTAAVNLRNFGFEATFLRFTY